MPPKGHPPKKKNISGLKNQSAASNNQTDNNTDGDRGDDSDQPPKNHKDMAGVNRKPFSTHNDFKLPQKKNSLFY